MTAPAASGPIDKEALKKVLVVAAEVLVPAGFVVGAAYYFGWTRTRKLYLELGVDPSVLDFTTTDYLLRSLDVFIEMLLSAAVMLAGFAVLAMVLPRMFAFVHLRRGKWALLAVASVPVIVAAVSWSLNGRSFLGGAGVRFVLTSLAALVVWMAIDAWPDDLRDAASKLAMAMGMIAASIILLYAAFDVVWESARRDGIASAFDVERTPDSNACVILQTTHPLPTLDDQLGEVVTDLDGEPIGYRYGEVRILLQSAGSYFLWPSAESPRHGLTLVPETTVTAIDFQPLRRVNGRIAPCTAA